MYQIEEGHGSDFTSRCHISIFFKLRIMTHTQPEEGNQPNYILLTQLSMQNLSLKRNSLEAPKQLLKCGVVNFNEACLLNSLWWIVWDTLDSVFSTAAMLCWIRVTGPTHLFPLVFSWRNNFSDLKRTCLPHCLESTQHRCCSFPNHTQGTLCSHYIPTQCAHTEAGWKDYLPVLFNSKNFIVHHIMIENWLRLGAHRQHKNIHLWKTPIKLHENTNNSINK